MGIKIDPRDTLFSKLVRTRARWQCEFCHKQFQEGDRGIECAHIIGRRAKSVRWHPDNALSLCHHHHRYFTENPIEFIRWLASQGHDLDALRERARPIQKITEADKRDILAYLKAEWASMQPGKQFSSPYPCDRVREAA